MKKYLIISIALVCIVLGSCKKDSSGHHISGQVLDENGNAVSGATVTYRSGRTTTDASGNFSFSNIASGAIQLKAEASGYFVNYKNVENIDGSGVQAQIVLLTKNTIGALNATAGGTAGATGLRVIAPANAFTTASGAAYTGNVFVNARYIDKNNSKIADLMPGGDFAAIDAGGAEGGMRTYGFVATEFTDADGNVLTPANTVKTAVTLPGGVADPTTTGAQAWAYDQATGKWGSPTQITTAANEYYLPCITLYQNIDAFVPTGTIEGTVTCSSGAPAAYVPITIESQYDKYVTVTNQNGKYKAKVEATNGSWSYTISATGGTSITVSTVPANQTTTAPDLTESQCSNGGGGSGGSGQFTYGGGSYSGMCASVADVSGSGGIDVTIATGSGASFIIYNMPTASSGTYSFTDGWTNVNTSALYALCNVGNGSAQTASQSGTVTKTGANSFTFSCTMSDIISGQTYSASGSGTY